MAIGLTVSAAAFLFLAGVVLLLPGAFHLFPLLAGTFLLLADAFHLLPLLSGTLLLFDLLLALMLAAGLLGLCLAGLLALAFEFLLLVATDAFRGILGGRARVGRSHAGIAEAFDGFRV